MPSPLPSNTRVYLGRLLRRLELLIEEVEEYPFTAQRIAITEQVMEMRGICATLLQWEIEEGDRQPPSY